jgi:hypothetical protein
MPDEVPKPKLVLKQPIRDVRVSKGGKILGLKIPAKKVAPAKKVPLKKTSSSEGC